MCYACTAITTNMKMVDERTPDKGKSWRIQIRKNESVPKFGTNIRWIYIAHLIFWRTSEEIYKSGLHVLRKSRRKNILFWAKLVPRLPNY
jgi:hypothetical protein